MTTFRSPLALLAVAAALLLPTAAAATMTRPGADPAPALTDSVQKLTQELTTKHPQTVALDTPRRAKNAPAPQLELRAYLVHNKTDWYVVVVNRTGKGSTEINPYAYCRNNPFLYTDPSGLWEILSDKGTAIADKPGDSLWRLATKLKREYGITLSENEIIDMMVSANRMKDRDLVLLNGEYDISAIIPQVGGVRNVSPVSTQTISPAHETGDVILNDFREAHGKFEYAGGLSVHGSTVNPLTSGGGGVYGFNAMRFSKTGRRIGYSYASPEGMNKIGLDVGAAVESVWAVGPVGTGPDQWAGEFQSIVGSGGPFTGAIFWSPGEGGWTGISLGFNYGPPGLAYEETFYTGGDYEGPVVLRIH